MRALPVLAALAAALLAPAVASAQSVPGPAPTVYVCTPTGQVLTVNGSAPGPATVLYTGSGSFDDCVLGPDGWLYVSNDLNILRFDPANPTGTDEFANTAPLTSKARGLAFNLDTLYINTASTGLWRLTDISKLNTLGNHTIASAAAVQSFALATSGHGVAFDVPGNMVLASGTTGASILSSAPPYASSAPLPTLPPSTAYGYPFGVAVNTCREVVFADKTSRTIYRRDATGAISAITGLTFPAGKIPLYLEIDSSNRIYIVTAKDTYGSDARIWRADPVGPDPLTACGSYTKVLLVELEVECHHPSWYHTSSSSSAPALLSEKAMGIAIAPTSHTLKHTFTSSTASCSRIFDFGYHTLTLKFDTCPALALDVTASRSRPFDVTFDTSTGSPFGPGTHGMRYSPLGGYVLQYVLNPVTPSTVTTLALPPFQAKYAFFTQEVIGSPGIARTPIDALNATFTEDVTSDYWDIGVLDAAGGERGDDFSKRVVFNSDPTGGGGGGGGGSCTRSPFERPLNVPNPTFKSGQDFEIGFDVSGAGCNHGVLHVSIVKLTGTGFEIQEVKSEHHEQTGNVMSIYRTGHNRWEYEYDLETEDYEPGDYLITIWGNLFAPITKPFTITECPIDHGHHSLWWHFHGWH